MRRKRKVILEDVVGKLMFMPRGLDVGTVAERAEKVLGLSL